MRVTNKKTFNDFIKFMKDEEDTSKSKRVKFYEELGGLNASSKAKFIVSSIAPYLYDIVNRLEEITEDSDNHTVIEELDDCFTKIGQILKRPEQIDALDAEFKELNLENTFSTLKEALSSHKSDIYSFTRTMFSTIFEDLREGRAPDALELRAMLAEQELYELITKKNHYLTDEEFNIGKMIINALASDKQSVNTEIVGRVYAYVKSGWAKADLYDQETISNSNHVKDLIEVVDFLKDNQNNLISEDRLKYEEKLAKTFNSRLNEIAVKITYDRDSQSCVAGLSDLKADRTAGSGTSDIAIQEYKNPSKLLSIYCTSNHSLYFTNDNRESWSLLSHQKINRTYLKGKSLEDIDTTDKSGLRSLLPKEYLEAKIKEVEVCNIAPATLATDKHVKELVKAFNKQKITKKELALINSYPIFDIVLRYKPDDKEGTSLNVEDIYSIKENVLISGDDKVNPWDEFQTQFKYFNIDNEKKEHFFINNIVVPYVVDIWNLIENKELKDDYVINSKGTKSNDGRALNFVNTFPNFLGSLMTKIVEDIMEDKNVFSKSSKEQILAISESLLEHNVFNSAQSKNTTGKDLTIIKMATPHLVNNLQVNKKNKP